MPVSRLKAELSLNFAAEGTGAGVEPAPAALHTQGFLAWSQAAAD